MPNRMHLADVDHPPTRRPERVEGHFRILPPRLIALLLTVAAAVHLLLRLAIRPVSLSAGVVLVVLGITLNLWTDALFRRASTPVRPDERPEHLITQGPFRVTRNPMYAGMAASLIGIALIVGTWPFVVPPVIFLFAAARVYIPFEEGRIQERFPEEYTDYRRRVRRWL